MIGTCRGVAAATSSPAPLAPGATGTPLAPIAALAGVALLAILASAGSPAAAADLQVGSGAAFPTISAAMATASSGDRVLVETGTYAEQVILKDGVQLLGGYPSGNFSANRNWIRYPVTIDAGGTGPAVSSGPSVGSTTVVDGFRIRNGGGSPGAAVLVDGGAPVFRNNDISNNRHIGITGAVYVLGGSNARFEANDFRQNFSLGSGGAMRIQESSVALVRNNFVFNQAPNAGGAVYAFESTVACTSNSFSHLTAGDQAPSDGSEVGSSGGGAMYFQGSQATLVGNAFRSCRSTLGGALMIRDESTVTLEDNEFDDCRAVQSSDSTGLGGAVAITNFSEVVIRDTRIRDCSAENRGGGLYARRSSLMILGTDATDPDASAYISNCVAGSGGGIYLFDMLAGSTVSGARIEDCTTTAGGIGGGLMLDFSGVMVTENLILRCTAEDGGGVCFFAARNGAPVNTFLNNTLDACGTFSSSGNPGGGLLHQALGGGVSIATIAGNLVTNTTEGASLRCRGVNGPASRPILHCSSFHNASTNPTDDIANPQCVNAFSGGNANLRSDGAGNQLYNGPMYCTDDSYGLKGCAANQDVGSVCPNALSGRANRGVTDATCACLLVSLEDSSWGQVKARYRGR